MKIRILTLAILLAPLAACTPNDTTMGGAFRHDVAMQTIDPDPHYAGTPMEGGNGARAAKAVDAYTKGTVKQPASMNTTTLISGTSGSSGSSGTHN